jgi:hypothetical protein
VTKSMNCDPFTNPHLIAMGAGSVAGLRCGALRRQFHSFLLACSMHTVTRLQSDCGLFMVHPTT